MKSTLPEKQADKVTRNKRIFYIIWFGQLISTVGSGLTGFALSVWVYEQSKSTTLFALNVLAFSLPTLLMSPLAGALVDRWNRRWIMILSDTCAGLTTLAVWILYASGHLEIWHVLLITALNSAFTSFQWPAYSAVTTMLMPKKDLGRASGMVQIGEAISQLVTPVVAGGLYVAQGMNSIILIDFITFGFAVITLFAVRIPKPRQTQAGKESKGSLLHEAKYGWHYIRQRKGLLGLLLFFAGVNFFDAMFIPLFTPMLLEMAKPDTVGIVYSIIGLGMFIGTLVMSAWGGPKDRVKGVFIPAVIDGMAIIALGINPSLTLISIAGFIAMFFIPLMDGSSQALWQSKVEADIQGRVFSVRRMIAWSAQPLGILIAGPLAEKIFEPLLREGGSLAPTVGKIIGTGSGRGTGLLYIVIGFSVILFTVLAFTYPPLRHLERDLPDAIPDIPQTEDEDGDINS